MTQERTYITSTSVPYEDIAQRDAAVQAAEKAGFIAEYEKITTIFNSNHPEECPFFWLIKVYAKGKLDNWEAREAKAAIVTAWRGL